VVSNKPPPPKRGATRREGSAAMQIDLPKIIADIKIIEGRIRATGLYVLRAYLRGRLHLRRSPRLFDPNGVRWDALGAAARIAERVGLPYALPDRAGSEGAVLDQVGAVRPEEGCA
jgi:hypothetical protein